MYDIKKAPTKIRIEWKESGKQESKAVSVYHSTFCCILQASTHTNSENTMKISQTILIGGEAGKACHLL